MSKLVNLYCFDGVFVAETKEKAWKRSLRSKDPRLAHNTRLAQRSHMKSQISREGTLSARLAHLAHDHCLTS